MWHLERQGFPVYLPQYLKKRRHARKTDVVRAPLFPGYLFIWLSKELHRWKAIQSTVGIRNLVCQDGRPLGVPDSLVEELREREDGRGLIDLSRQSPFQPGERVQVTEGALLDQSGIFECASGEERAVILLRILGRDMRVTLPQASLARA